MSLRIRRQAPTLLLSDFKAKARNGLVTAKTTTSGAGKDKINTRLGGRSVS
jgi:hypothetical protein